MDNKEMIYPEPKPFIVVAGMRTGATFLCHCLSNHPQVFCHRGETMHHRCSWRVRFPKMRPVDLLDALLHQTGYHASGCKLLHDQLLAPEVLKYAKDHEVAIIFLTRADLLSQAVSLWIVRNKLGHPLHTITNASEVFTKPNISPAELLKHCEGLSVLEQRARRKTKQLGLPTLFLTYEELTGNQRAHKIPNQVAIKICDLLEVKSRVLASQVRKVHSTNLRETLGNYDEVREVFLNSKFASRLGV